MGTAVDSSTGWQEPQPKEWADREVWGYACFLSGEAHGLKETEGRGHCGRALSTAWELDEDCQLSPTSWETIWHSRGSPLEHNLTGLVWELPPSLTKTTQQAPLKERLSQDLSNPAPPWWHFSTCPGSQWQKIETLGSFMAPPIAWETKILTLANLGQA